MIYFEYCKVETDEDLQNLYDLVEELAAKEGQAGLFVASFAQYRQAFLSDCPAAEGVLIQVKGELAGFAVILRKFATYLGSETAYIEDLYLREPWRDAEAEAVLLGDLAKRLRSQGYWRIEMRVLKGFSMAEDALKKAGFSPVGKWQVWRNDPN
jgi:GNAT superfamily N-acetyltransferase